MKKMQEVENKVKTMQKFVIGNNNGNNNFLETMFNESNLRFLVLHKDNAKFLMEEYQIPEGKNLGIKLKSIEEEWVKNNFKLSKKQIDKILSN